MRKLALLATTATSRRAQVVLMCAVASLTIAACGGPSKTFDKVLGKVVDSRTGKAITQAQVAAAAAKAFTSSDGTFTLVKIPKVGRLTITGRNYRSNEIAASASEGTIRLVPIPVEVKVTSTFTRRPLASSVLAGAARTATGAGGSASVFHIGPGDILVVSAPGYLSRTVTVGPTRGVRVSLEPTRAKYQSLDLPLIRAIWRNASDAWGTGGPDGDRSEDTFVDAHNYPGAVPQGIEQSCPANISALPAGYSEEYVLNPSTIERDDGWVMPAGALKGQRPKGRLYIMQVTTSYTDGSPSQLDEAHVTILNRKAYRFNLGC